MADESEEYTALSWIARETLHEIEAAMASAQACTYSLSTPDLPASLQAAVHGITQPVYSCLTCFQAGGTYVGLCEPCMLRCHVDHEVIELGLRRNFRCDCPTVASSTPCCAQQAAGGEEEAEARVDTGMPYPRNTQNVYNHNFKGLFCSCEKEYNEKVDEMMQCIACDDWYHSHHIPGRLPSSLGCEAFVCARCVAHRPFLQPYTQYNPAACTRPTDARGAECSTLQPWRVCLTCTMGADDGRGVCMACAARCHAGHVLGEPRITDFYCDCSEVLGEAAKHSARPGTTGTPHDAPGAACKLANAAKVATCEGGSCASRAQAGVAGVPPTSEAVATTSSSAPAASNEPGTSSACEPTSPSRLASIVGIAPPDPSAAWCAARDGYVLPQQRFAEAAAALHAAAATNGAAAAADVCVSGRLPKTELKKVSPVCIFITDDNDLLLHMCRCEACMKVYAHFGVAQWFFDSPVDVKASSAPGAACLARTTQAATTARAVGDAAPATDDDGTTAGAAGTSSASRAAARSQASGATVDDGVLLGSSEQLAAHFPQLPRGFKTSFEQGLAALSSLPHTTQMDAVHGYQQLAGELLPFLRSFAESGRVVTVRESCGAHTITLPELAACSSVCTRAREPPPRKRTSCPPARSCLGCRRRMCAHFSRTCAVADAMCDPATMSEHSGGGEGTAFCMGLCVATAFRILKRIATSLTHTHTHAHASAQAQGCTRGREAAYVYAVTSSHKRHSA
ncbi:hypothetical protein EON66_02020 [archaeon]|nr:MAG: hypothetical protein EON66_02020 [archaeon]